ncbi:MAG: AMP-binding protein, partial [Cocleimonas sp.]
MTHIKQPLWEPAQSQIDAANVTKFINEINVADSKQIMDFSELHDWSINHPEKFWSHHLWQFAHVIADKGNHVLDNKEQMPGALWFSDSKINFAENLLQYTNKTPQQDAIIFRGEDKIKRRLSFLELEKQVASVAQFLRKKGIAQGDIVAAYLPNMPEAVITMLATASLGAIWTS